MDPEAEEFLNRLKAANAEEIRLRVEASAKQILEEAGVNGDRLKEVVVDVSDFLEDKPDRN